MLVLMTFIAEILQVLGITQPSVAIRRVMHMTVASDGSTVLATTTFSLSDFLCQQFPFSTLQKHAVLIRRVPCRQTSSFRRNRKSAVSVSMQHFSNFANKSQNDTPTYQEVISEGVQDMDLLTIKEAAEQLRLSTATVHKLIEAGKIPAYRFGKATRIPKVEFDRWMASSKVQQETHDDC